MRGKNRAFLIWAVASVLVMGLFGCSHDTSDTEAVAPKPAATAPAPGGVKPQGGMIAGPSSFSAPSGTQTGNFAGGKKD